MEPHWRSQWMRLSEQEKSVLRSVAGVPGGSANNRILENLTKRGMIANGKPFARFYEDWLQHVVETHN